MRTLMATAIVLIASVNTTAAQQVSHDAVCKADQIGGILLTSVEYDSGYKVEAPWRVLNTRVAKAGTATVTAVLDHIIETDPASRKRQRTTLPAAIELTFSGANNAGVLREAANVWCSTVAKALAARHADVDSRGSERRVVM